MLKISSNVSYISKRKGARYFNWSHVIPAWKINIKASTDGPNTSELSYEERYQ